ncbi:putative azaleucine resistance protein AzlC [Streptococcus urinalis 2285-97]|uniref:Azaleucine resistance protein AzlC n=2 Tax=Streptococcus urinalis TaxID=149016 RepID=G5KEA9_9STRE|nr:putative azaleucine resistance protein AzlC [Streptococcus urinalis 2285-97]
MERVPCQVKNKKILQKQVCKGLFICVIITEYTENSGGIMTEKGFQDGVKAALPTAMGYVSIGLAFGIVASASDLSVIEVGLMSALVYGGSAQFAMCALLLTHANLVTVTLTVFLVNLRNMLMSLHATTIFKKTSLVNNIGIGTLITDESYGVLLGEALENRNVSAKWMHGNNVMSYLTWVISTMVGTLLGNAVPNPEVFGLDFALVAMFIGLFVFQLIAMLSEEKKLIVSILVAVGLSYYLLSIFLSGALSVLVATLIGCSVGVMFDGK